MKQAIIFDMDGVVSDTQCFHAEVESNILKRFDISISAEEITNKYAGFSDEDMFGCLFKEHGVTVDSLEAIIFEKWGLMKEIAYGRIVAIPHAIHLIHHLKEHGFKLAIASGSTLSFINYVVDSLNIRFMFDALVSTQEVKSGKPAPDIFLKAAKKLGVEPCDSVVIEDGRSGMIAARSAGMKSIGFVSDTTVEWPADLLVTSLAQINISTVHNL